MENISVQNIQQGTVKKPAHASLGGSAARGAPVKCCRNVTAHTVQLSKSFTPRYHRSHHNTPVHHHNVQSLQSDNLKGALRRVLKPLQQNNCFTCTVQ